jgi:CarD family transcriptional regulator
VFGVGDLVVYPAQGVGKIESIERKDIGAHSCSLYIVRILGNNMTLMVPVDNARNAGLRPLTSPDAGLAVLDSFSNHEAFSGHSGQNWNRRHREYMVRLKRTELGSVADVLHELLLIGRNKELSFGERRLLDQAMSLVCGELALVLGTSEQAIRDRIQANFADAGKDAEERSEESTEKNE